MINKLGHLCSRLWKPGSRWVMVTVMLLIGGIVGLPGVGTEASSPTFPETLDFPTYVQKLLDSSTSSQAGFRTSGKTLTQTNQPDGLTVISAGNIDELQPIHILDGQVGAITALAISPDSTIIAASSVGGQILMWDTRSGDLIRRIDAHDDTINSLAFSPDGSLLASGSNDESVRLWDTNDGSLFNTIEGRLTGRILDVRFTPDGRYVAMAGHKCVAVLRDAQSGIIFKSYKQRDCLLRPGGSVESWGIDFTANGNEIILGVGQPGCNCGSVQLWEIEVIASNSLIYGYQLPVKDLDLSSNGSDLAVAMIGTSFIRLIDAQSVYPIQDLEGHAFRVNSVHFSPDGELLASASTDRQIGIWDPDSGELLRLIREHTDAVMDIQFSPDGTFLASGSSDNRVILWGIVDE